MSAVELSHIAVKKDFKSQKIGTNLIKSFEDQIKEELEQLNSLQDDLRLSKEKYDTYTLEERELADVELRKAIETNVEVKVSEDTSLTIEEIRNNRLSI